MNEPKPNLLRDLVANQLANWLPTRFKGRWLKSPKPSGKPC